jgi:hypothetical protein
VSKESGTDETQMTFGGGIGIKDCGGDKDGQAGLGGDARTFLEI